MKRLTRNELAKKCEINIESLRYYERRKLIDPPPRSDAGYRLYSEDYIVKIRFIQNAQKLGFTLNEISELLKLRVQNNKGCTPVMRKAQAKFDEVGRKIKGLRSMQGVLKKLIAQCEESIPTGECPILASFESEK